jgi:hypothetical protein
LQTLKIREDIYKDRLARQQSDPAGSVELAAARAAEGMSEDKMLAVRLELQARNGVPAGARRVLTDAQAKGLGEQWEGVQDAAQRAALLAEWKGRFGAYFPEAVSEAKLPPAVLVAANISDTITGAQTQRLLAASGARDGELPPLDDTGAKILENSDFLKMNRKLASLMFASGEAQTFAAGAGKALQNYVRLYGTDDLDDNFLVLDQDNLLILAPKTADKAGITAGLEAETRKLRASVPAGGTAKARAKALMWHGIYDNGRWIYDNGAFVFIDAGTGRAVTTRSMEQVLKSAAETTGLPEYRMGY